MGPEIPFKPPEDLFAMIGPALAVLAVMLAAAVAVLLGARRFGFAIGKRGAASRLRVLERLALSRRASLLVVEWEGRRLLVGQSGERLSLIASAEESAGQSVEKAEHEAA